MIYVIGCGGGGSWLAPSLCLLVQPCNVTLIDGDTLELKNLNRQLFHEEHIGQNKAKALGLKYGCNHRPDWYTAGLIAHCPQDWLFACVDNNKARLACLEACDMFDCRAIFAANERTSAEAYVYMSNWKDGPADPRIYYPSILTDKTRDPQAATIGCTGEAQVETPQLVSANFMSASLAQWLYVLWAMELPPLLVGDMGQDLALGMPFRFRANASKLEQTSVNDL